MFDCTLTTQNMIATPYHLNNFHDFHHSTVYYNLQHLSFYCDPIHLVFFLNLKLHFFMATLKL